jgi:3-deoxy-7-phosphoheptulonate synthase
MGKLNNKFPGKDVSNDDLKNKFPLSAKKYKTHKSKFKVAGIEFGGKTIPIFAGPNLAESRSLVFKTAKEIKKIGIHFM